MKIMYPFSFSSSGNFCDRAQEEQQHIQVTLQAAHRKRFRWNFVLICFLALGESSLSATRTAGTPSTQYLNPNITHQ